MGDSNLVTYLSALALVVTIASVVVTVIAWRIKNRPFRIGVGISLLIVAGSFVLFSVFSSLFIGGLGLVILFLGIHVK